MEMARKDTYSFSADDNRSGRVAYADMYPSGTQMLYFGHVYLPLDREHIRQREWQLTRYAALLLGFVTQ